MAEIRIENLHKAFGDFVAVKDSSFTVGDGDTLGAFARDDRVVHAIPGDGRPGVQN